MTNTIKSIEQTNKLTVYVDSDVVPRHTLVVTSLARVNSSLGSLESGKRLDGATRQPEARSTEREFNVVAVPAVRDVGRVANGRRVDRCQLFLDDVDFRGYLRREVWLV